MPRNTTDMLNGWLVIKSFHKMIDNTTWWKHARPNGRKISSGLVSLIHIVLSQKTEWVQVYKMQINHSEVTCCLSSWLEWEWSISSDCAPGPHTSDGAAWTQHQTSPPPGNTHGSQMNLGETDGQQHAMKGSYCTSTFSSSSAKGWGNTSTSLQLKPTQSSISLTFQLLWTEAVTRICVPRCDYLLVLKLLHSCSGCHRHGDDYVVDVKRVFTPPLSNWLQKESNTKFKTKKQNKKPWLVASTIALPTLTVLNTIKWIMITGTIHISKMCHIHKVAR